jgi:hypothetical protein
VPTFDSTSSRSARISGRSEPEIDKPVGECVGTSCVSARLSSSHFFRPPFSSFTLSNPRSFKIQYAYAANQLLLPP